MECPVLYWECETCTLHNPESEIRCKVCGTKRNPNSVCLPVDSIGGSITISPRESTQDQPVISPERPVGNTASSNDKNIPVPKQVADNVSAASSSKTNPLTGPIGITEDERKLRAMESNAKRRKCQEERDRIQRQFEEDRKERELMQAMQNQPAGHVLGGPVPSSAPVKAAPANDNASIRIQLKASNNRSLLCSCYGPSNTLQDILDFANEQMPLQGRIIRQEFHPAAHPQFVQQTQQMLRQAAGPAELSYCALKETVPPRTRYADDELKKTLREVGIVRPTILVLEEIRREGEDGPQQAHDQAPFVPEGHRRPNVDYWDEADSDDNNDDDDNGSVDSDVDGSDDDSPVNAGGGGRVPVNRGGFRQNGPIGPNAPNIFGGRAAGRNQDSTLPTEGGQALGTSDQTLTQEQRRELMAKRFAAAPQTAVEKSYQQGGASSSFSTPAPKAPVLPLTVPGSKTKAKQAEEQAIILARMEEERREREELMKYKVLGRKAQEEESTVQLNVRKLTDQKKLSVKCDGATKEFECIDATTFQEILTQSREFFAVDPSVEAFFKIAFPPQRWSTKEELGKTVLSELKLPCVVMLQKVNDGEQPHSNEPFAPAVVNEDEDEDEDADPMDDGEEVAPPKAKAPAPPTAAPPVENTEEERRRQREARLKAIEARGAVPVEAPEVAPVLKPSPRIVPASKQVATRKPGQVGLSQEERKERMRQLEQDRLDKAQHRNRILGDFTANREMRDARPQIPVALPKTSLTPGSNPLIQQGGMVASARVLGDRDSYTRGAQLRVRDVAGNVDFYSVEPTSTLRTVLPDINPEEIHAINPFSRYRLTQDDWDRPLQEFNDFYPTGMVVLVDANVAGNQVQATTFDPFGPEGIAEAMPPPISDRNSTEYQRRMQKLQRSKYPKDATPEDCIICQCAMEGDQDVARLPCGHLYHSDCVERALRYSTQCPTCRQSL